MGLRLIRQTVKRGREPVPRACMGIAVNPCNGRGFCFQAAVPRQNWAIFSRWANFHSLFVMTAHRGLRSGFPCMEEGPPAPPEGGQGTSFLLVP